MPSSDERREVARRLRAYSHDFDFGDSNPFWYVAKAAFGDVNHRTYYDIFSRLADLIDPTCEVESVDSTGGLLAYNLSCGDTAFAVQRELRPSYCPNCGARVVSSGGELHGITGTEIGKYRYVSDNEDGKEG